jgi:hypothetical protein
LLGRNLIFYTAKLLQLRRITNGDVRYSSAPIAQMRMLAAGFISWAWEWSVEVGEVLSMAVQFEALAVVSLETL